MHESLHVDLFQLHEEAKGLDTGHVSPIDLSQLVGHEADLLPLHQLALGLRRPPLHLRQVPAHLRELGRKLLGRPLAPAPAEGPQRAVDDEVRVAADRAREMRVHLGGQAEVPEVLLVVAGQLHRPQ